MAETNEMWVALAAVILLYGGIELALWFTSI